MSNKNDIIPLGLGLDEKLEGGLKRGEMFAFGGTSVSKLAEKPETTEDGMLINDTPLKNFEPTTFQRRIGAIEEELKYNQDAVIEEVHGSPGGKVEVLK